MSIQTRAALARSGISIVLFSLIIFTSTRTAFAVDYTFVDVGGQDFFDDSDNWSPAGGPPNSNSDRAIFNLPGVHSLSFIEGDPSVTNRAIEVRAGTVNLGLYSPSLLGSIYLTYELEPPVAGSTVATVGTTNGVSATLIIRGRPGNSSAPLFGEVDARGPLVLGSVAGSTGRLDLGDDEESPAVAIWTSTHGTFVGRAGTGTLNVYTGSTLSDAGGIVGGFFANTGLGTANIQGTWNNSGSLTVGGNGTGTLNISGGTVDTDGDAVVALSAGESGTVNVTNLDGVPGQWEVAGTLAVGGSISSAGGTGIVNLNGTEVVVTAGALTVWDPGDVNITTGKLTVNGALDLKSGSSLDLAGGYLLTSPSTFTISPSTFGWTSGTLEFDEPYTIQTGHILGGSTLTVGANKVFIVGGALNVGTGALGSLLVNGGADVFSTSANLGGAASPGTADATITGAGSKWDISAALAVADDVAANLTVSAGGQLNTATALASNAAGSTSNIDLAGAGTLWANSGSAYLGGSQIAAAGAGTLDITTGAKLTVGDRLKVWQPFTVTLNAATIETDQLEALGTINVLGASTLKASENVDIHSSAAVTFSPASTFNVTGAAITISGTAALTGAITGDASTAATISSASTWTMPGSLEVGTTSAGLGHIGSLALQGGTTNVAGNVTVLDVTKFTLAGGTLNALSIELGAADFAGFGAINADFHTSGSVTATGNLTIGNPNSPAGAVIGGTLNVGSQTVTINKKGFYSIGNSSNITGGTLIVPNGVAIPVGNTLEARGTIDARVAAQTGSLIEATGDLVLGSAASPAGFLSYGELVVNQHTVTINDANEALLGSLTTLGFTGTGRPGRLVAANGAVVEFGKNIVGFGTVDTPDDPTRPLINNGTIWGQSAEKSITLLGHVKGVGSYDHVEFAGTFSPGFSPATVYLGSAVYGASATLVIELGSTTPGSGHDQLVHSAAASFGGTLDVELLGGFVPSVGNEFVIATYADHTGIFDALSFPPLAPGLGWSLDYGSTELTLSVLPSTNLPGDIDLDGDVDRTDAALFSQFFGRESGSVWTTGDFNGDAATTLADWSLLQSHLGQSMPSPSAAAAAVPEPGACGLMLLGLILVVGKFRVSGSNLRCFLMKSPTLG